MNLLSAVHGRPRRGAAATGGSILIVVLMVGLMVGVMAPAAFATVFSNSTAIAIPDSGKATPYPSVITVSGLSGTILDVNVALTGITHEFPDDIDVLLVGPFGQNVVLMADTGGTGDLVNVNLTFDDAAATSLPDLTQIVSGTFKPTVGGAGAFNGTAPAPAAPYGSTLAIFNGTSANGGWNLYVFDDVATNPGAIGGGWSLDITTNAPTVTSFSPSSGIPGTLVSINGTNFTGATAVTFGGVAATGFVVASPTLITATVPVGAVTGPIAVTTPVGSATSAASFTVSATAPTITSFSPASGTPGTSVVITGTNFTGATSVAFGGVTAVTFAVSSATQVAATVPTGAVTGLISVTTPAGTATSAASFTVEPLAGAITTEAPLRASVKKGKVATLRFRVNEAILGGVANVKIRIKKGSVVKKTIIATNVPMNSLQKVTFRCKLAKGTYKFYVSATTTAGGVSTNTASNTLKVK